MVFVCSNGNYIETEFGPYGHYLILELDAPRNIVKKDITCNYKTKFFGSRWKGFAEIPLSVFPERIEKINLFAIFRYSQQTEYIAKAIQIKKTDKQQLKTQKYTETLPLQGKILHPTETGIKHVEIEEAQNKKPTEKDLFADDSSALPKERIHLLWSTLKGDTPDFHQPDLFPPCPDLHNPTD